MYRKYVKRPMDFITALFAGVFLLPLILCTALSVRIRIGSPVIFCQKRPGLQGKIFTLYKFRTMTDEMDEAGKLLPEDKRLTKFGRKLRSSSLDELPELFNILKGDMSIVGPRPLLVKYLGIYNEKQKHRHDVRPGLTGLAQINGRNGISWEDKFRYDLEYINRISFIMDLKIIILTMKKVIKKEGINSEFAATMEEFTGKDNYTMNK